MPTGSADWISAVCSVIAAVVSLATLLTVFVAAQQILSRRQVYRLGLSFNSLGPWRKIVISRSFSRLQTKISTPAISLPRLVAKGWEPKLTFPTGFVVCTPEGAAADPEGCLPVLAEASWVNFLEGLGLTPGNTAFYNMQSQSELVNGIVPMRWKGKDLVGLCSMLGFQAPDDKISFSTPMPLPIQWLGPLGWLQFRASSDGCIVEYRRRAQLQNQLSSDVQAYYKGPDFPCQPICLASRLWWSIDGMPLPNDELLFIGGADKSERSQDREDIQRSRDKIFDDLMETDRTPEEIRKALWGGKSKQPHALRPEAVEKGQSQLYQSESNSGISNALRDLGKLTGENRGRNKSQKMCVLNPCPGLLSIIIEGEFAFSRGIKFSKCYEYHRVYTDEDEVNNVTHPYRLGHLCMDEPLLGLVKKAVLKLEPDGFYFTSPVPLLALIWQMLQHIEGHSDRREYIFPPDHLESWKKSPGWDKNDNNMRLYYAMTLCNEFQHTRKKSRAMYTIEDMGTISRAFVSLRRIISSEGTDLVWAMIQSPQLFSDLIQRFEKMDIQSVLAATVNVSRQLEANHGLIDCKPLECPEVDLNVIGTYSVPLLGGGKFTGYQVLAAFLDVLLIYFWIDNAWITNVGMYDATIPQSVTMC